MILIRSQVLYPVKLRVHLFDANVILSIDLHTGSYRVFPSYVNYFVRTEVQPSRLDEYAVEIKYLINVKWKCQIEDVK